MNRSVIDSSCWLEYFNDSDVGKKVSIIIKDIKNVIVPTIVIYEVFKKLVIEKDEDSAIFTIGQMKQGIIVELNQELALLSAKTSLECKLSMADSIIYTISKKFNAMLYTQDKHFEKLKNVTYYKKTD